MHFHGYTEKSSTHLRASLGLHALARAPWSSRPPPGAAAHTSCRQLATRAAVRLRTTPSASLRTLSGSTGSPAASSCCPTSACACPTSTRDIIKM